MNMFRDILIMALLFLGGSLMLSDPTDWKIVSAGGPYIVEGIVFLVSAKPFSFVICFALALALFMTRLKY